MIGTAQVRYFVQGLGGRKSDCDDFASLPDAEGYFERLEGKAD